MLGTLNNCGGGVTPWGTVLSAERDFHQYFANAIQVSDPVVTQRLTRYGIVGAATERKWERFDPRFDLAQAPNEVNRFGWIVEVDPLASQQRPVKHTALGRFKHEAATIQVAKDGRVVCYMGDGDRFEYIYKFVSDERMVPGSSNRDHNKRLLDAGTLYVARFEFTSAGEISCPDSLAFDGYGNLWIATGGNALGSNDGLFAVPLEGPERGHLKQFLTVPFRAETCGPVIEPQFVLVAVQHTGQGGSVAAPNSHWPDGGASQPRPAVVSIYKAGRSLPGLIGE